MKKTLILMLSSILMVVVLAACSDEDNSKKEESDENASEEEAMELPEPDLEGIPDIVAEINGKEVTKEDFESVYQMQFQQAAMQAQMSGEEINEDDLKKQTAEGLVGQELLVAEANSRISDVPKEDVDSSVDQLIAQYQMESKDELFKAFAEQGMEEKELMKDIETQVKVEQFVAEEAGDMEPTDKEAEEAYETLKTQQEEMGSEEEVPAFDEIKSDLKEQLKQQKEAEAVQDIVEKLRKDADVTIFI